MKLEKRTIEEWIYTNSKNEEMKLTEMSDNHLMNSYNLVVKHDTDLTYPEEDKIAEILCAEILRRMKKPEVL